MVEHVSNQQMSRMIEGNDIVFEGEEPTGDWQERAYTTKFQRSMQKVGSFPSGSVGAEMQSRPVSYYTQVEWEEAYAKSAHAFLNETLPKLEALSGDDPESVRIVFWFDN
jgi:hypothetical protein